MACLVYPLPQSPQYARALQALGLPVRLIRQTRGGQDLLSWQIQSRQLRGLGRIDLISRGPVVREGASAAEWLSRFGHWHDGRPLLLNAVGIDACDLRVAGFFPVFTASTLAMLPLGAPEAMRKAQHPKWRNRLRRAEGLGLVARMRAFDPDHWLMAADARQARARGYRNLPLRVVAAFAAANPGDALIWEVRSVDGPLAAVLILRHGPMATWQTGHSTPAGRKANAMNVALWSAMAWLAEARHDCLDLGTVNTDDAPGLARFKLGTGAHAQRLGGSWLHLPPLAPLARFLPVDNSRAA